MISALLTMTIIALACGAVLGYAAIRFKIETDPVIEQINQLLPQTQCGQCGYPGCKPYASAIASGEAINKCPPGGDLGIKNLAQLLGREIVALDPEREAQPIKRVAFIREAECIGCTKCIQACPVDAIVGAPKLMHTVISDCCTGCDLCVAPCPVDCIDMLPTQQQPPTPTHRITHAPHVESPAPFAQQSPRECIRCGDCVEVCPAGLLPQQLYWTIKTQQYDKAVDLHLSACIECGDCADVCPSTIPLLTYYREGKAALAFAQQEQRIAAAAKSRFEWRQVRLARDKDQRAYTQQARIAVTTINAPEPPDLPIATPTVTPPTTATTGDDKAAQVAAAVARAKAKKAAAKNTEPNRHAP